jgi:hypothetical protein
MPKLLGWILRAVAGFLAAGVLAPFTLALPESLQGPGLVFAIMAACLVIAFSVGKRLRMPR